MTRTEQSAAATHADAMAAAERGDADAALAILDAALARPEADFRLQNTRAEILAGLGRLDEAEAAERLAWAHLPGNGLIANNLGSLLRRRGKLACALHWFRTAASLLTDSPEIACSLAETLADCGQLAAASAEFERALQLSQGGPEVARRFGVMLLAHGRAQSAERLLRRSLAAQPNDAPTLNDLGLALQSQNRSEEAMASFAAALRCDGNLAPAHYNLGCLLLLDGKQDAARECHDRALAIAPNYGPALWARCMVELPVLYDSLAEIGQARARYSNQLEALTARASEAGIAEALAAAAGASQPFFLPYQGQCDRELQTRYGELLAGLMPRNAGLARPGSGPVRLGIVSGYFCEHTVWRLLLKGWLRHIDRSRFAVTAYHTGTVEDEQTAVARQLCPRFVTGNAGAVRDAILADQPHVLLYPEVGMDSGAARLAAERLAPVQCVAWGQPQTTGLPTMDVFLSSALMEPEGAEAHYTEQLLALPNLGICYEEDERPPGPCDRAQLGVRQGAALFWCGQAIYKYLPQYDDLFARIAEQTGDCQFMFIGFAKSQGVTEQLRARLNRAFARRGLDGDRHILIVKPGTQEYFLGTVAVSDVVLDGLGWSGGKSTLDMLVVAPVIVTWPGPMMRGRHTAAILGMMGIEQTVARSADEFCRIAAWLAPDEAARDGIRQRMAAARTRVLGDLAPIRAMEDFLISRVANSPSQDAPETAK